MDSKDRGTYIRNLTYTAMAGQVGCLPVLLTIGLLLVGLWVDALLDTRPAFTLVLVLLSVPLSLYMMVIAVLGAVRRITPPENSAQQKIDEEYYDE